MDNNYQEMAQSILEGDTEKAIADLTRAAGPKTVMPSPAASRSSA